MDPIPPDTFSGSKRNFHHRGLSSPPSPYPSAAFVGELSRPSLFHHAGTFCPQISYLRMKAQEATMFCNACGSELQPGYNVCPKCGKAIGDPVSAVTRTR